MKKIYFLFIMFLLLYGCKQSDKIEINFAFYDTDEASLFIGKKINEFNKNDSKIKINAIKIQKNQLLKKSKGKAPKFDVVRYSSNHIQELADKKIIKNYKDIFDPSFYEKFLKEALLTTTYKENIWGIPDNYGNHILLFYNKKIINEMPETSDELVKALEKKIRYNNDLAGIVFNQNEPEFIFPLFFGFDGNDIFESNNDVFDKESLAEIFDFIYNLKYNHNVLYENTDYNKQEQLFNDGKAAITINGFWAFNEYKKDLAEFLGISDFPVISLTSKKPISWASTNCYSITKKTASKKKIAAIEFIKYMTSEKTQEDWLEQGRLPSIKSNKIEEKIKKDTLISESYKILLKSKARPLKSKINLIAKAIRPYLEKMLENKISPDNAAMKVENYYQELINSNVKVKNEKK